MVKLRYPRINFRAYRHERYMLAVYQHYGQGVAFRGQAAKRESCPLCSASDRRSRCFSWSFQHCAFYCHKCKARGDALELVRVLRRCPVVEAARWLEEMAGPAGSGLVTAQERK